MAQSPTVSRFEAAQKAINTIGLGFDLTQDINFDNCKSGSRLILIDEEQCRRLEIPGGVSIPDVSSSIRCVGGESIRINSDVLTLEQMLQHFNGEMRLSGNFASGHFCASFGMHFRGEKELDSVVHLAYDGWFIKRYTIELERYHGELHNHVKEVVPSSWDPEALMLQHFNHEMRLDGKTASGHFCASFGLHFPGTKELDSIIHLAYDGWFIKRYAVELERYHGELHDHVKEVVPLSWDPEALARFIERFGTHVVVGVSMGGKEVLYVRQDDTSDLHDQASIQKLLTETAGMKFMDSANNHRLASQDLPNKKKNLFEIHIRRGGSSQKMNHCEWLDTIDSEPDIISMHLLPLTTLLSGIPGYGFAARAINLYLQYKPPIEDLHQFLEFQLPREWAPIHGKIHLDTNWKHTWLRLSILSPKLYINTNPVDVGIRPVTGLRLQLEGKGSNRLAINLQHLASLPKSLPLADNAHAYSSCDSYSCKYHKKLKWNCFSYVCTAPIESDDSISIVTGAQLQVEKKCLLLRLRFSKVIGATLQKPPEWDQSSNLGQSKEGHMDHPMPGEETVSSLLYSGALPRPVRTPKLQRYVDRIERIRGPKDTPGYWAVSGAKLSVHNGKI